MIRRPLALLATALVTVQATGQTLDTTTVRFNGVNPPARTVVLDTACSGNGARGWRAAVTPPTALAEWLTLTPTGSAAVGGSVDLIVGTRTDGLPDGLYSATIAVTTSSECDGTPVSPPRGVGTIDVELDLFFGGVAHLVDPTAHTFNMTAGDPAASTTVDFITSCPAGQGRTWNVGVGAGAAAWLTAAPNGGSNLNASVPLTLTANPTAAGLNPADSPFVTTVTVTSTDCMGDVIENPDPGVVTITLNLTAVPGDSDLDGIPDPQDNCPDDPNADQADRDGDDIGNVCDPDRDGDDVDNTADNCPDDPNVDQADADSDGTGDTCDLCPDGDDTVDADDDGVPDCADDCPLDANKSAPGACGCGIADTDTDGDATADCDDECPNDPAKIEAGGCGCGADDEDTDFDGTANCIDGCPTDPNKTQPGACGCGDVDDDFDFDGIAGCNDACSDTPLGEIPDDTGCGASQRDTDSDGRSDADDLCPMTPVGQPVDDRGCAVFEMDSDGDGLNDAVDQCPDTPNGFTVDGQGCPVDVPPNSTDTDGDGVADGSDLCPATAADSEVDLSGCPVDSGQGLPQDPSACGACGAAGPVGWVALLLGLVGARRRRR